MPREVVAIAARAPDYEYAAQVYEVLAYPDDHRQRERFGDAFCYIQIREAARSIPGWAQIAKVRAALVLQDPSAAEKSYGEGLRIISNERLIAAKQAAQTIGKADGILETAVAPTSNEAVMEVSIDLDARPRRGKAKGKSSEGNRANIVSRRWSPSRPVLHLALALHFLSYRLEWARISPLTRDFGCENSSTNCSRKQPD